MGLVTCLLCVSGCRRMIRGGQVGYLSLLEAHTSCVLTFLLEIRSVYAKVVSI
jgi:hypothetical protein